MPTLFISYKRDDKVAVTKIADRLRQEFYYDIWLDAVSIRGGEDWRAEIRKGIDKADVVLLLLTPDACASPQVKEEVDYAQSVGRKILPLQIKKVSTDDLNRLGVEHLNFIDFVGSHDDRFAWEKLLNDLPPVLARDKRLLDPAFKKLHRDYLRTLFTRYGTVSLAYLLDAAPREAVRLMDVYVPLKLGVSFNLEVQNGEYVDWWLRDQDAPRQNSDEDKLRDQPKPKALLGFVPSGEALAAWVEQLKAGWAEFKVKHEKKQAEKAEKDREPLEDGTYYWNRIESEIAPALMAHLVITGDPGSGKSTLMKHLALCLAGDMLPEGEEAQADRNQLGFWPLPAYTPVFVELRALVRTVFPDQREAVTLEQFFAYLRDEQLKPYGVEDYLDDLRDQMRDGDVLFCLDGLDEVPDAETPERREQIKAMVALLRGQFPKCRIVVTSRPYAYAGDWQLDGFGQVKLAQLDPDRLEELALRLFRVVLGQEEAEQEAAGFKEQVERVPEELRRNPLFFTLMAAIWLNHQTKPAAERLPVSEGEIYRECVDMLIRRWTRKDLGRGRSTADAIGLDESQLRLLLETLAFQLHSEASDKDDAEFKGGKILDVAEELRLKRVDVYALRDALAQRAGIIYEKAPNRYQFAHRSFQEHLAACYLAREQYPQLVVTCVQDRPLLWRNVVELLPAEAARAKTNLRELLKAWLPGKDGRLPDQPDSPGWLHIYYAARLLRDHLTTDEDAQDIYRPRLQTALAALVAGGALTTPERAEMGRVLAELDDPRPGVGLRPDGLPDIDWVDIPAGTFLMGSDKTKDEQAQDNETPQRSVTLPAYRISRYPVTYTQF